VTESMAIIGTPVQWALIAGAAILLFAPQLVPAIARVLGRMMGREVQRRYGIKLRAPHVPPQRPMRSANVEPPQIETEIESRPEPIIDTPRPAPESVSQGRSSLPVWAVTTVAAGLAAVLLWILLHGR
jgi:hypothetical protein